MTLFSRIHKRSSIFCSILVLLSVLTAFGETDPEEERYCSYERFFLKTGVIGDKAGRGGARGDIERFVASFNGGLYALSAGNGEQAREDLLMARKIWPEYFGADFVLARIYEDSGDAHTAARYYKSYLNKLRAFSTGRYRISAPLIRSLMGREIEAYDAAEGLVRERLSRYGIDLGTVRPAVNPPMVLFYALLAVMLAASYLAIVHWAVPYYREQRRIKYPPEGFWVCRYCHTTNPVLNKVCEYCGRKPEESGGRIHG
jgi:tetratricopeptide (TPR) repeat protein